MFPLASHFLITRGGTSGGQVLSSRIECGRIVIWGMYSGGTPGVTFYLTHTESLCEFPGGSSPQSFLVHSHLKNVLYANWAHPDKVFGINFQKNITFAKLKLHGAVVGGFSPTGRLPGIKNAYLHVQIFSLHQRIL